jgi:hypothetical protein
MTRHTKPAQHVAALGLYIYQKNRNAISMAPRLEICANCQEPDKESFYNLGGWCDDCACAGGYLPPTHVEYEERLLFKALFDDSRPPLATWDQMKNLTMYWRANRASLLKGEFDETLLHEAWHAPVDGTACLWEGCTNLLGATAVAGYCGTTCYARGYRLKNKESIRVKRMFKQMNTASGDE